MFRINSLRLSRVFNDIHIFCGGMELNGVGNRTRNNWKEQMDFYEAMHLDNGHAERFKKDA